MLYYRASPPGLHPVFCGCACLAAGSEDAVHMLQVGGIVLGAAWGRAASTTLA